MGGGWWCESSVGDACALTLLPSPLILETGMSSGDGGCICGTICGTTCDLLFKSGLGGKGKTDLEFGETAWIVLANSRSV